MRRRFLVGLALTLVVALAACRRRATMPPEPRDAPAVKIIHPAAPGSFVKLIERLRPSVVQLSTTMPVKGGPADWFPAGAQGEGLPAGEAGERMRRALGTGFLVDAQGAILTSAHVVGKDRKVHVQLAGAEAGTKDVVARVVGLDAASDVALLQIEPPAGVHLVPARLGDSDQLQVGEWVIAVGNPFGQGLTASVGVLSARERRDLPQGQAGYLGLLQTDAAIHAGNSGGPLCNALGEVVGINTVVGGDAAQRVGFAVPLKLVQQILPMLRREGKVVRAWIGIYMDRVTPEAADRAGLKKPLGALVTHVVPRGPAERAGLRAGDVIVSFDNRDVPSATELPWIASPVGVGRMVPVKVWRDGKPHSFTLVTERMPE